MKYLKVWTSFRDVLRNLEYDEIGRLFEAMLLYAESGEEPAEIIGNERFIWPMAKQMIDMAAERNEILRQNGSRGGRPRNQEKPSESKNNQSEPNETKENQTKAEKKRKEIERKETESYQLLDDDEAHEIQSEQNRVLDAAEDAGFKGSNTERAALIKLYAEHGLAKMLDAIQSCVEHGAVNLAYLKACLNGTKRGMKVLPAQDFEQRDYSDVPDQLMQELVREIKQSQEAMA